MLNFVSRTKLPRFVSVLDIRPPFSAYDLGQNDISDNAMTSEHVVIRAKRVAQECAMKASYYRCEFIRHAWRQTIAAALLIPLGLILLLRVPAAGFIVFVFGAVAARGAYSSFQYAGSAYGEYDDLPRDRDKYS
jgi:hypothetical protein